MEKPNVRCFTGSLSATNARKGSILIFIEESIIHSNPAAIQSVEEFGIKNKQKELSIAPIKK